VSHPPHQQPKTVAILGTNTAVNGALSLLLKGAGYDTRRVEKRDVQGLANGLLEGVDLLLFAPGFSHALRETLLTIVRNNPLSAHLPVLTLSSAIGEALSGEKGGQELLAWPSPIEELVLRIEAVLVPAASGKG
jgi:DNA-binding response OmpR family regulator